ncbi:imidazoleglycerol-phosphate dehydratase [candidate division WOR-1 bacterium RIFOXYA12_FULL_43_27]|uniref:Imidazoleglycerol-phosphate dehydratase n=1 Tax=candidate division WOR-1 bacterium RIFOXYC2_FULL_46_14 TaxID=1802587 RepID=A0A1F4U4Y5_UNCSA|nr:MAG: imidazoleglycerol-phosphate dehydratase [candidate division WOR-1 bacterium RIFOXYA12_FULL_43_27]OGC20731.1 MAG: imidazoleglycerol-phosphate dehydratase [candidate division WOR-1 bacterium RIFOXYB2_FULL_46_45]OGC31532.1 MAG: imidazoleglycerol-phosphate dehydratase [candidate division WOR-1 bacterium RIFOXYA2_FULL_46_56]OGC39939.1 MAG: imidazoleglycerol-phosphate dehydratase [candidate division WOR-1 bacterium RIFOXYC2_FULL_46_14]
MARKAQVVRKTKETQITIGLNLDGSGKGVIATPLPFFNHMLELFAKHGIFDLKIEAKGDIEIDPHHLIEDTGLALGEAFNKALGKKLKIERYGHAVLPMDESLAEVKAAIDISGRPHFTFKAKFPRELLYVDLPGGKKIKYYFDAEMLKEFFESFVYKAGISLHIELVRGKNTHHKIEAIFKAFGVALSRACAINKRKKGIPSTKGLL